MALHLNAFQFRIRCSLAGLVVRKVDFQGKFELFSSFIPNKRSEIFTKAYSPCLVRCCFYLDLFCFLNLRWKMVYLVHVHNNILSFGDCPTFSWKSSWVSLNLRTIIVSECSYKLLDTEKTITSIDIAYLHVPKLERVRSSPPLWVLNIRPDTKIDAHHHWIMYQTCCQIAIKKVERILKTLHSAPWLFIRW